MRVYLYDSLISPKHSGGLKNKNLYKTENAEPKSEKDYQKILISRTVEAFQISRCI